jgi:hemolysin-activating ACP:hemolysin acyltransferase
MPRIYHTSYYIAKSGLYQARDVGNAVILLGRAKKYSTSSLANALQSILPAIQLQQYRMYFAEDGAPNAMITWAWLSDYSMNKKPMRPIYALPRSEWNEGRHLCIIDVLSSRHDVSKLISDFLNFVAIDQMNFFTYSVQRNAEEAGFFMWHRNDHALLVASLEAQC